MRDKFLHPSDFNPDILSGQKLRKTNANTVIPYKTTNFKHMGSFVHLTKTIKPEISIFGKDANNVKKISR